LKVSTSAALKLLAVAVTAFPSLTLNCMEISISSLFDDPGIIALLFSADSAFIDPRELFILTSLSFG